MEKTIYRRRWLPFIISFALYILIACQDSGARGLLTAVKFSKKYIVDLFPIPSLLVGILLAASFLFTSYNKKTGAIVTAVISAALGAALGVVPYFYTNWICYCYPIVIIVLNIIVLVYNFTKTAPTSTKLWNKMPVILTIVGILLIAFAIILSFSIYSYGGLDFRWNNWGCWNDNHKWTYGWWEGKSCIQPLGFCYQGSITGTNLFPISTGLLCFVAAAGINLDCSKKVLVLQKDTAAQAEGAFDLMVHIVLCLFTFGVWHYVWIYRTTRYLNQSLNEENAPWKKVLLCLFVPFYYVYWYYTYGQKLDKLTRKKGISKNDISTLCWVVAIFVPVVSCILMQERINATCTTECNTPKNEVSTADQLKEYKELLDSGVISQEEFDAKKKQLLGL